MPSKRLILLCGLMLLLLPPQVYGATLQYESGAFAITPYIYGKITADSSGILDPPVIGIYNPGPQVGINNLSGSKDLRITTSYPYAEVRGLVSWNLQANYGKNFSFSCKTSNWMGKNEVFSDNLSFIRMDTRDGLILRVAPEAGERIGQPVKLFLTYDVNTYRNSWNEDEDPGNMKLEAGDSQPNRINVNGVPNYLLPMFNVNNTCLSADCIPWPGYEGFDSVRFYYASHDGPWPYNYEGYLVEYPIEANPGELIHTDGFIGEYLVISFNNPLTCKIGDLIGLNLGYFQELSDTRSDRGGIPVF